MSIMGANQQNSLGSDKKVFVRRFGRNVALIAIIKCQGKAKVDTQFLWHHASYCSISFSRKTK